MKTNKLTIDLSQFVDEQIADQIKGLEKTIADKEKEIKEIKAQKTAQYNELNRFLSEAKSENDKLKANISKFTTVHSIFSDIKERFNALDKTASTWDECAKSKQQNQFHFISELMKYLYGAEHYEGFHRYDDSRLEINLAVAYYNHKESIMELVRFLFDDPVKINFTIKEFRMPFEYTRDEVLDLIKNPKPHTNGKYFGLHQYWMCYGAGKQNIPYDLLLKNKFVADDEIFTELIKNTTRDYTDGHNLLAVTKYNSELSNEQITRLGRELLKFNKSKLKYSGVSDFFDKNKHLLDKETLDYYFTFIEGDRYGQFAWTNYPEEYQLKFLKEKSMGEIVKALNDRNWNIDQINALFTKLDSSKIAEYDETSSLQ